jgi:hypothetical protein
MTWVLVLIVAGAGVTSVPGYGSLPECVNAGDWIVNYDNGTRKSAGDDTPSKIVPRCLPGPSNGKG